jgi:polyphosphate kinase
VKSNDKRRGRLNAMRYVLSAVNYEGKDQDIVGTPDPLIVGPGASVFEINEGLVRDN